MKNGFEIYTNNSGGITLYIISDGRPVVAFPALEQLLNYSFGGDTLRGMISQLYADPTAYEDWDGAWDGDVEAIYEDDANPDRDHDLSELGISGEYDDQWYCTVTVSANPMGGLIELLGWDVSDR